MGYTKKALIREAGHPLGQPAPMYLVCVCGNKVPVSAPFDAGTREACSECGQIYDGAGWLVEGAQ